MSGVTAAQTTRDVPGDYATIQAAIDDAEPGDAILVADGTYEEHLLVTTSDLTIRGESREGVIIDASGESGRGIEADAPGLTFESFTLIGTSDPAGGYGLKVEPSGDGVVVREVTVVDSQRTGIDLHGVDGGTVEHVAVSGTVSGNGLALTDCTEVRVAGATTTGNGWGGLALYTSGAYVAAGLSNVTVTDSAFVNEPLGLYAQDSGATGPEGFTDLAVKANSFADDGIGVLNLGGSLDVTNNRFEIPDDVSEERSHVRFQDGAQGEITGNRMSGAHRAGILVMGDGTEAEVSHNEVVGSGPKETGWAENGIQVGYGARAVVANNRVESNWWEGADWSASGILVVDTSDVVVRRNHVRDTELSLGVVSFFESEPTEDNTIERNTVIGGAYGVALQAVGSFGPTDAEVSGNVVAHNTLNSRDGVVGISESEFGADAVADGNDIVRNRILGYETAVGGVDDGDREDNVIPPMGPPDG